MFIRVVLCVCELFEFMAFICYYCHVFVMCSFNTWMKLFAEYWSQSSWEVTLSPKFGVAVHFISEPIAERGTSLIHVRHDQLSELVRTLMMRFLKQSVVGGRLENPCCLWV